VDSRLQDHPFHLSCSRLRWLILVASICLFGGWTGCALRTVPPVRFVPIVGAQEKITTTRVLIQALRDRDVGVRAEAVELLGVLGQSADGRTKAEIARVLGIALKDQDPGLRLQAVEKLGGMDASVANKYLISALRDPNTFVRTKVLSVIGARERLAAQQQAVSTPPRGHWPAKCRKEHPPPPWA